MQVYSSLPPFPRMMELLQAYVDDAKYSYDPLGITQFTLGKAEKEYSPEDFAEMKKFIDDNGLPVVPASPSLDILGFNYVNVPFDPEVPLPTRATERSAGYDFYLPRDIVVGDEPILVQTGVSVHIPKTIQAYLAVFIRSSLGKDIRLLNGTGIIDADYEGNPDNNGDIGLLLQAQPGRPPREFKKGERIAQGIILPYTTVAMDVPRSTVRTGGFGSTNKKKK